MRRFRMMPALSAWRLTAVAIATSALIISTAAQAQESSAPVAAGANNPGMTWQSLAALPDLLNARWVPIGVPSSEQALLKKLPLPPLKPEFIADAKAEIANIVKGETQPLTTRCGVEGQPRIAWYPAPLKFMYGAGSVMLQAGYQTRSVSVAGLRKRTIIDPNALIGLAINGEASGVWEGDTLVIRTYNVREDIDTFYGVPNDPDLEVVERYRLLNKNTLERVTTVTAPLYFSAPWVYRTTYQRTPLDTLASIFCEPKGGWFSAGE